MLLDKNDLRPALACQCRAVKSLIQGGPTRSIVTSMKVQVTPCHAMHGIIFLGEKFTCRHIRHT